MKSIYQGKITESLDSDKFQKFIRAEFPEAELIIHDGTGYHVKTAYFIPSNSTIVSYEGPSIYDKSKDVFVKIFASEKNLSDMEKIVLNGIRKLKNK
ncbi:MAG: hypothetical protein KKA51_04515 [Nanoarchaeota archaeon]|nr:hypothetical protein [Nanoarchaeota archaeon]